MKQVFLSTVTQPLDRWLSAFPDTWLVSELSKLPSSATVWLDCHFCPLDMDVAMTELRQRGIRFLVMESVLSDERGLHFLQNGASGYVHRHASPEQLKDIAMVVKTGGVWMGQDLLQKALQASLTIGKEVQNAGVKAGGNEVPDVSCLTERELAVAREVGRGASNREIAEALAISERTVKAHLSVAFEKLMVRDRVQLALLMNNIRI